MNSRAIALSPHWRCRRLSIFNLIVPYSHTPGSHWSVEELGLFQFYRNTPQQLCSPLVAALVGAAVFGSGTALLHLSPALISSSFINFYLAVYGVFVFVFLSLFPAL